MSAPLIGRSLVLLLLVAACRSHSPELPPGSPDNGGLSLPDGFEAVVVADSVPGRVRHLAVGPNGDVYAKLMFSNGQGSVATLRDTNGDGRADIIRRFGNVEADGSKWSYHTGIRIYNNYLYFSSELVVYRYPLPQNGALVPEGEPEVVFTDDHAHGKHEHIGKPITFDDQGHIYIPFGAPTNACQNPKRTPGAPGQVPCRARVFPGGFWVLAAGPPPQTQKEGKNFPPGIGGVAPLAGTPADKQLYSVVHGRDDLMRLWPALYSGWQSAVLPAEEFIRIREGDDFGWPYCYYDQVKGKKVLGPEYGGNGDSIGRCKDYELPLMGFPGHWAPNDLQFYRGAQFPQHYQNGAFVAFHGSTNRAPYPQAGYFVAFVPFQNGQPGTWEVFADGFAGVDPIVNVSDAKYRPMGIAVGPDGSLYLAETEKGKIWRVMYKGNKKDFGPAQLAAMEQHKNRSHIRQPDPITDNLERETTSRGESIYYAFCGMCHQQNGKGASGRFPPLAGVDWVTGDKKRLINVVLYGREGPMEINGQVYEGVMPQHSYLPDEDIAEVLSYIRSSFGNQAGPVTPEEVKRERVAQ